MTDYSNMSRGEAVERCRVLDAQMMMLVRAAKTVMSGLNDRLYDAAEACDLMPVFDGIAGLHDALAALPKEVRS